MDHMLGGRRCYPPEVVATWSRHSKKCFVEEKLLTVYWNGKYPYCIQRTVGEKVRTGGFLSPREMSCRMYVQMISPSEAETWLKEHLSGKLYEECINAWPFVEEKKL